MGTQASTLRRPRLDLCLLLGLLLFRAYVPVGFMPANGTPFLLELCPAAGALPIPTDMPMDPSQPMRMPMDGGVHHQHSGAHGNFAHCPFGSAPGAGPISPSIALEPPGPMGDALKVAAVTGLHLPLRKDRAHPTRGPPTLG